MTADRAKAGTLIAEAVERFIAYVEIASLPFAGHYRPSGPAGTEWRWRRTEEDHDARVSSAVSATCPIRREP